VEIDLEKLKPVGAILFSVLLTLAILYFNPAAALQNSLGDLGYFGVFLIMFVTSATVILPAPGLLAVFAAGSAYNPILVGIFGGLGSALGELSGYLLGFGSSELAGEKNQAYNKVRGWMNSNGFITIFVFSVIPNPLFDLAGIAAGSLKYSL